MISGSLFLDQQNFSIETFNFFLGRIFDQAHLKTKIKIDDDFNLKIKLKLKAPFQKSRENQETLFINLNFVITTPPYPLTNSITKTKNIYNHLHSQLPLTHPLPYKNSITFLL